MNVSSQTTATQCPDGSKMGPRVFTGPHTLHSIANPSLSTASAQRTLTPSSAHFPLAGGPLSHFKTHLVLSTLKASWISPISASLSSSFAEPKMVGCGYQVPCLSPIGPPATRTQSDLRVTAAVLICHCYFPFLSAYHRLTLHFMFIFLFVSFPDYSISSMKAGDILKISF